MFNGIDFSLPQALGFAPTLPPYIENPAAVHALTQPSVLLVSTYLDICGPHWTDFELVRADVQLILFGGTRPQIRHAYVETHDRQWIISPIAVQSHDFLVIPTGYIKPMKTLYHGWARKANDRRRRKWLKIRTITPWCASLWLIIKSNRTPICPQTLTFEKWPRVGNF